MPIFNLNVIQYFSLANNNELGSKQYNFANNCS